MSDRARQLILAEAQKGLRKARIVAAVGLGTFAALGYVMFKPTKPGELSARQRWFLTIRVR